MCSDLAAEEDEEEAKVQGVATGHAEGRGLRLDETDDQATL